MYGPGQKVVFQKYSLMDIVSIDEIPGEYNLWALDIVATGKTVVVASCGGSFWFSVL